MVSSMRMDPGISTIYIIYISTPTLALQPYHAVGIRLLSGQEMSQHFGKEALFRYLNITLI